MRVNTVDIQLLFIYYTEITISINNHHSLLVIINNSN